LREPGGDVAGGAEGLQRERSAMRKPRRREGRRDWEKELA
jgi:hypothetical protein